jgi:tRNA G18 (ribose-2'-O)-methylase SpoU
MSNVNYSDIIAQTASNHFNVQDKFKNNTVEENKSICNADRLPFSVGVVNVAGDLNIGMMIRSASLLGATNFLIFGRKKYDKRSTVGADNYINIQHFVYDALQNPDQLLNDLQGLENTYSIVLCEQGGVNIRHNFGWRNIKKHPLFLFGSESHGLPEVILNRYPKVSIPQRGVLRSFNVSASMNIILWDYIKEMF